MPRGSQDQPAALAENFTRLGWSPRARVHSRRGRSPRKNLGRAEVSTYLEVLKEGGDEHDLQAYAPGGAAGAQEAPDK